MAGCFCVWVERKFLGLGLGGKKISRFVFKFVGWVCVYFCWLGLISGGGGWIFLCLGREKISRCTAPSLQGHLGLKPKFYSMIHDS